MDSHCSRAVPVGLVCGVVRVMGGGNGGGVGIGWQGNKDLYSFTCWALTCTYPGTDVVRVKACGQFCPIIRQEELLDYHCAFEGFQGLA